MFYLYIYFGQSRDTALQIAVAQGIVMTVLGHERIINEREEKTATDIDVNENPHCSDEMLGDFINKIIKVVPEPNPASRLASAIWLLVLVKNCSNRSPIYKRKQILQFAFTELLADDSGKNLLLHTIFESYPHIFLHIYRIYSGCCFTWVRVSVLVIRSK